MSKFIDSLASGAPGLVSTGVSTLGNLLGLNTSASTSYKYQLALASQQFEYNKQLLQMQQNFNNPKTQLEYYKSAGINPYAALGNNTSVSLPSVGQGSVQVPDLSHLGSDAVSAFQNSQSLANQSESIRNLKDLQIAQAQQAVSQARMFEQSKLKLAEDTKNQSLQNSILETTASDHVNLIRAEVQLYWANIAKNETQAALTELQSLAQIKANTYLPKQIEMQLAESASRIQLQYLQGQLTKAQASSALSASYLSMCQATGVKIDNGLKAALQNEYVDNYVKQTEKLREEIIKLQKENSWSDLHNLLQSLSTGVDVGMKGLGLGLRAAMLRR